MAPGDSPGSASAPMGIRRTVSSQSVAFDVRSAVSSGTSVPRQQSTQDRISEILEVGRQRAGSMHLHSLSPRRTPTMAPSGRDSPSSDHARAYIDEPDERTSFGTARNTMNYQGTQTTASLRSRQPPLQPDPSPAGRSGSTTHNVEDEKHWLWGHLDGIWSIELENKGSVARDHLAVERTFLAWLRTSLSFASIGIAITQLFRLNATLTDAQTDQHYRRLGRPLGATFIGISILVLLLGYQRFYEPQQWLLKGKFPASRGPIILISLVAFALMLVSLIVVVVVQPPGSN
ncbi:hypothetical protein GGR51DRAFT_478519 [Nemania sp. FL0031]|nr:hypothetical protein GGR51DRAFT_478519 [Nemania sp. FL0031]